MGIQLETTEAESSRLGDEEQSAMRCKQHGTRFLLFNKDSCSSSSSLNKLSSFQKPQNWSSGDGSSLLSTVDILTSTKFNLNYLKKQQGVNMSVGVFHSE